MKRRNLLYLLPALVFMSCSEDSITDPLSTEEQIINEELDILANVEVAHPDDIGKVAEFYFAGQLLPVEEVNGDFVFQGDILLPPDMLSTTETVMVYEPGKQVINEKSVGRTQALWPNNTVYYAIDGNLANQTRVTDAIKHWEQNTNLTFIKRSSQSNYIYFTTGSGCASYIGMIGGKQDITLATGCSTGNTIHEIGHAIGLWHEQSRVDRDKSIKILYDNIQSGREHNFKTYAEIGFDGKEYTSTLDFGSIMMYGPYSFSKNGNPTIVKADGSTYSFQRSALSSGDRTGVNGMYPDGDSEPTYINGNYYTISGLTVLRYNDLWYFRTIYGFKRVELRNNRWYWV